MVEPQLEEDFRTAAGGAGGLEHPSAAPAGGQLADRGVVIIVARDVVDQFMGQLRGRAFWLTSNT